MSEPPDPLINVPELTLVCGIPQSDGTPHHLSLGLLLIVEGKIVEAGKPGLPTRTPSSWRELAEMLVGTGHVQDGIIYRTGHCPTHRRVGVPESEVQAAFDRGYTFVHARKIGRSI
jgi:hypothetical protein